MGGEDSFDFRFRYFSTALDWYQHVSGTPHHTADHDTLQHHTKLLSNTSRVTRFRAPFNATIGPRSSLLCEPRWYVNCCQVASFARCRMVEWSQFREGCSQFLDLEIPSAESGSSDCRWKAVTLYVVRIIAVGRREVWTVYRWYSQFSDLRVQLCRRFDGRALPSVPRKLRVPRRRAS